VSHAEWQPIETAPKDGVTILVWDGEAFDLCLWSDSEGFINATAWDDDEYASLAPTHWMPLPEAPQ